MDNRFRKDGRQEFNRLPSVRADIETYWQGARNDLPQIVSQG